MMPLALDSVDDSLQNFHWAYKADSQNPTYENYELKVSMHDFISALNIPENGSGWIGVMDAGFSFYYIINAETDSYFSYIIVPALFNSLHSPSITPETDPWYKKLTRTAIVPSSFGELETLKQLYQGSVTIRNFPLFNSTEAPISIDTIHHPQMAFFTKDSIWNFLSDNNAFENNINLSWCTSNGGIRKDLNGSPSIEDDFKVQTPLFYIKDVDVRKLNNTMYVDIPYSMKALDIGHLCPPNC